MSNRVKVTYVDIDGNINTEIVDINKKEKVIYSDVDDIRKKIEEETGVPYSEYKKQLYDYLKNYVSKIQYFNFNIVNSSPLFDDKDTVYRYIGLLDAYNNFSAYCTNYKINHFNSDRKNARVKDKYIITTDTEQDEYFQTSICLLDNAKRCPIISTLPGSKVIVCDNDKLSIDIKSEDFVSYAGKNKSYLITAMVKDISDNNGIAFNTKKNKKEN